MMACDDDDEEEEEDDDGGGEKLYGIMEGRNGVPSPPIPKLYGLQK